MVNLRKVYKIHITPMTGMVSGLRGRSQKTIVGQLTWIDVTITSTSVYDANRHVLLPYMYLIERYNQVERDGRVHVTIELTL